MLNDRDIEKIQSVIDSATSGLNSVVSITREIMSQKAKWQTPRLYRNVSGEETSGKMQTGFGYFLAGLGGFGLLGAVITLLSAGGSVAGLVGAGVLLGLGAWIARKGKKKTGLITRFKNYVRSLGNKTVISVESLAAQTGMDPAAVREDLREMMENRMFLQGHFTEDGSEFITSDETYAHYKSLQSRQNEVKKEEDSRDEELRKAGMSTAGIEIIKQGEEYLQKIRYANDELPGEDVSRKLYELEDVVRRLLEEVKKQPAKAIELRRMMNYYLPTTWKLLTSYMEIDKEPVKTEKMLATQREIEATLDTINTAFRNLLDQLFQNRAWDVSSDISVLNTMIKQDNLAVSDFGR